MSKLFNLVAILALLPFFGQVLGDIPAIPQVWDPNYPLNRCVDYCAFLRPGEICPKERTNANCLCTVYNIRLPAVTSIETRAKSSVNNVGVQRIRLLQIT
jgi:hypothetical protein